MNILRQTDKLIDINLDRYELIEIIYIYIYRERERERKKITLRLIHMNILIYIHIYIYNEREREREEERREEEEYNKIDKQIDGYFCMLYIKVALRTELNFVSDSCFFFFFFFLCVLETEIQKRIYL